MTTSEVAPKARPTDVGAKESQETLDYYSASQWQLSCALRGPLRAPPSVLQAISAGDVLLAAPASWGSDELRSSPYALVEVRRDKARSDRRGAGLHFRTPTYSDAYEFGARRAGCRAPEVVQVREPKGPASSGAGPFFV